MKSLKESLFDDDLVSKEFCIGDIYELMPGRQGLLVSGVPIVGYFNDNKLKKLCKNQSDFGIDSKSPLVKFIMEQPIPKRIDFLNYSDYIMNLKSKLNKAIKKEWKWEWEENCNIYLYENNPYKDCFSIRISDSDDCGENGFIKLSFEIKK